MSRNTVRRKELIDGNPSRGSAVTAPPWASRALGDHPGRNLENFNRGLTVSLMATEPAALRTCEPDEPLAAVVERNRSNAFDFLPVTEPSPARMDKHARIVGLIEIFPYMHGTEPQGLIREAMQPLTEENLIG